MTFQKSILLNAKWMHISALLDSMMTKGVDASGVVLWQCSACDHSSKRKQDLGKHIESKHLLSSGFNCDHCGRYCPNSNALQVHVSRNHRNVQNRK